VFNEENDIVPENLQEIERLYNNNLLLIMLLTESGLRQPIRFLVGDSERNWIKLYNAYASCYVVVLKILNAKKN